MRFENRKSPGGNGAATFAATMGLLPARGFTKVFRQAGYPDERAQDEVGKAQG